MIPLYNYIEEKTKLDVTNVKFSEAEKIKNADETIKKFFPSLWNSISGRWQSVMFPALTDPWKDESKLFLKDTAGLKGAVYKNNMNAPNAYTIPGIRNKSKAQFVYIPLLPVVVSYYAYAFYTLSKSPIKAKKSGNIVKFTGPSNVEISMWETRGLRSLLPEDNLRKAVMMHEIGHWVEFEPAILAGIYRLGTLIPPIAIMMFVMSIIMARSAEWKADRFAAKMGYADDLTLALSRVGYNRRTEASLLVKINDFLRVAFTKVHNVVDRFAPISVHPSIQKRTTALQESLMIEDMSTELYITELVKLGVLEEGAIDAFSYLSKQIFKPADKLISRGIKRLFPLSN